MNEPFNVTNITIVCEELGKDKSILLAAGIIDAIILTTVLWAFLCGVIYGTKTGRWWNKPGTSSLNNGMIYVSCITVIGLTLPHLAISLSLDVSPWIGFKFLCDNVMKISEILYFVYLYTRLLFLWLLQRLIYMHPSVKGHIGSCVNQISRWFLLAFTAVFIGAACIYMADIGQHALKCHNICVPLNDEEMEFHFLVSCTTIAQVILQAVILALSIYPAFRVRFEEPNDTERSHKETLKLCSQTFCLSSTRTPNSPIEIAVKRTFKCSIVIVGVEGLATVFDLFVISDQAPVALHYFVYNVSTLVTVFAMLAVFSFANQLFTLFFPTCSQQDRW